MPVNPQLVYVCDNAGSPCPVASYIRVDGATPPPGATVQATGGGFRWLASNTGTTVADPGGIQRPVIQLVCLGPVAGFRLADLEAITTKDKITFYAAADNMQISFLDPPAGPFGQKVFYYLTIP